jgi:DNA-binding beta-propeller fold protein YncE
LVYAADYSSNRVQVFRVSDGGQMRSFALSAGNNATGASGICISPCGEFLYVSVNVDVNPEIPFSCTPQLIVLRTSDGSRVRAISLPVGHGRSSGICVSPDGELLFICFKTAPVGKHWFSCVKVLRTRDDAIVHTIDSCSIGGQLDGVCVSPSGDKLYITSCDRVGSILELTC